MTAAAGDYLLDWEPSACTADMAIVNDDLATEEGLRTASVLSLFLDRRAEDDDPLPAIGGDKRGWWADQFAAVPGDRMGSRLWLLDRAARRADIVPRALAYAKEALAWMLDDKVAASIDVTAETSTLGLLFAITIHRPQGDPVSFRYAHVWRGEEERT